MEIKVAVCDDELQQARYVRTLVHKWADASNITATVDMFESAEEFKAQRSNGKAFDILLLDIQMSGQNGIELAREIRQSDANLAIVFITGFTDYMADGYDVSALHYLIKPISEIKLFEVLDRAVNSLKEDIEFLSLIINRENIIIPLSDIVYIESSLHYSIVNTQKEQYKVKMPLTEIEAKLSGSFFKCTRSFIVGLRYIRRISKNEVILTNGISVPLGRGLYKDINKAVIRYC